MPSTLGLVLRFLGEASDPCPILSVVRSDSVMATKTSERHRHSDPPCDPNYPQFSSNDPPPQ